MKHLIILSALLMMLSPHTGYAQEAEPLPYHAIPKAPENFSPGNVLARMVDGLGYRYYWATEGLREEDLAYRPSAEARSTNETITHVYDLSLMVVRAARNETHVRADASDLPFAERRSRTLKNLAQASQLLRGAIEEDIASYKLRFPRGDSTLAFPYWNVINGPLSDALYHTGQIVSFRRSSGNPMNPNVNVFIGRTSGL